MGTGEVRLQSSVDQRREHPIHKVEDLFEDKECEGHRDEDDQTGDQHPAQACSQRRPCRRVL